jgi:MoaA/NifB/PqqE/SkfB family radical SAM enzyme
MRVTEPFKRSKMDLDSAKRIIDAAAQRGVKALSFTGGEPMLYLDEIVDLLKHARASGITFTRTGTNGYLFANPERPDYLHRVTETVERLAESGLYTFWISIDSADPVAHEQMRGLSGVINGIERALPIFHARGIYPSANLGINKNIGGLSQTPSPAPPEFFAFYRVAFRKFYRLVVDLGFTIVNVCYPMSIEENDGNRLQAVYGATDAGGITRYTPAEKEQVFNALFHTIPEFRHRIRIFSPRSSLFSLMRQHCGETRVGYPCRGGKDYFFIDAREGNTYPCGYRGNENLGKFWDLTPAQTDRQPSCKKCDWECFRDPSEMIGPLISLFTSPGLFYGTILRDAGFRKLWLEDLNYFRACDFFDCSKAPDFGKLALFGHQQKDADSCHRLS